MNFSVATWNCFGMGQSVLDVITYLRAPFGKRFHSAEVINECSSANVLCVQELLSRAAQVFFDNLVRRYFPFALRDHNRFGLLSLRGSGLGIAARERGHARTRTRQSRFLPFRSRGISWDKYARKGALYAQIEYADRLIDVMTVHLQSGMGAASTTVRAAQLAELAEWIRLLGSSERPFIVCGDFNIQGLAAERESGEYQTLTRALAGFTDLGAESDLATYHPHPEGNPLAHAFEAQSKPMRIDYIFLRPAETGQPFKPSGFRRILDRPLTGLTGLAAWASDHYGLLATFDV
ncbi:MAG: hypothetical protein OHK0011_08980 [Turneriella sp.]